jgi:hypothetical protein
MSKRKPQANIRRKKAATRKAMSVLRSERSRRWLKMPLATLAIISTIAGALTLIPRVSLEIGGSLEPHSPLKTVFMLSNESLLSIHDIEIECHISKVIYENNNQVGDLVVDWPNIRTDTLSAGQKMSLPCDDVSSALFGITTAPVSSAIIGVSVIYRPDFSFWHRRTSFPLEAQKAADGTWIWRRLPN